MTLPADFMLGSTLIGMQTLDDLLITTGETDAMYRPFSVVDKLGDLSDEGNGFPVATWHWNALAPGEADILYGFIGTGLSAFVYFRTRLNRLTSGAYTYATFSGWMNWMSGDEQVPALHVLDLTITFTGLTLIPD